MTSALGHTGKTSCDECLFQSEISCVKHNIPRASEKIIMAKVSGHISKHVNVINIIHDVNSTLHSSRLRRSKEDRVIELISKEVWRK